MELNIADFEQRARRRLPRFVFDFVAGGADDEVTLRANRQAFARIAFRPRVLVDVSTCDLTTTVLGERVTLPVVLAPTGLVRLVSRRGELDAAAAAGQAHTIFALSTVASYSIEEVASVATGPLWFQLYPFGGRVEMAPLIERAQQARYRALCFTVDAPVSGNRERDFRNRMTLPPSLSWNKVFDVLRRPRWLCDLMRGGRISIKNLEPPDTSRRRLRFSLVPRISREGAGASITWDDLRWVRQQWSGPLVLKGVLTAEDAHRALDLGVNGIVVSNHGGRQLDGTPAAIEVLPEIAEAVNGRAEIFLDGGIRRGTDVVKAIALGAKACLIGRPYWYGLAVGGEHGVARVLHIFRSEIERTLMLLGRPSIAAVDRSAVRLPGEAPDRAP